MPDDPTLRQAIETAMGDDPIEPAGDPTPEPTDIPQAGDPSSDPEPAAAAEPTDPEADPSSPPADPEPASEPIDPPTHWAAEHQDTFRALDPKAQAFLLDRQKEMEGAHTKRSQEIAPLRGVLEKWNPYTQQMGVEPSIMVDNLMQAEYTLRTGTNEQKIGLLMQLANQYGIQLGTPEQPEVDPGQDPFGVQAAINSAINPVMERINGLENSWQSNTQSQQQASVQAAQQQIDQFRSETGQDGKPLRPYFDEVQGDMQALAQARQQSGQPVDLASLYEQATWANPSVRAKIQAAEKHAADLARRKADQERAEKARKAAGSLPGGAGGSVEQPVDRRAAIRAAFQAQAA